MHPERGAMAGVGFVAREATCIGTLQNACGFKGNFVNPTRRIQRSNASGAQKETRTSRCSQAGILSY
jgi:hypothetical protein